MIVPISTPLPPNVETPTGYPVGRLRRRVGVAVSGTVWGGHFVGFGKAWNGIRRSSDLPFALRILPSRRRPAGFPAGVSTLAGIDIALFTGIADQPREGWGQARSGNEAGFSLIPPRRAPLFSRSGGGRWEKRAGVMRVLSGGKSRPLPLCYPLLTSSLHVFRAFQEIPPP